MTVRRILLAVVAIVVIGALAWSASVFVIGERIDAPLSADQISKMEFQGTDGPVAIPRDRWPEVLSALFPAHRISDFNRRWKYSGELTIVARDGAVYQVRVWSVGSRMTFNLEHDGSIEHCEGRNRDRFNDAIAAAASKPLR